MFTLVHKLTQFSWHTYSYHYFIQISATGTPVLARDIPGNAALLKHGHTGLLYASPEAFLEALDSLLHDSVLLNGLVTAAMDYVARYHSLQKEKDLLLRILKQAML